MTSLLRGLLVGAALAAGVLLYWGLHRRSATRVAPAEAPTVASVPDGAPRLACSFELGDSAAFDMVSTVDATNAGAQGERFASVLSWRVVGQSDAGAWILAANLSSTELGQNLTRPQDRLVEPIDAPFILHIDRDCRFTSLGFSPRWQPATRRLVTTMMRTFELIVASDRAAWEWQSAQTDGTGTYAAAYRARRADNATWQVHKRKTVYRQARAGAQGLGIEVELSDAGVDATFDRGGRWFTKITGKERMRLKAQGRVLADLAQRFSIVRDDAKFSTALPSQLDLAAFQSDDPFAIEPNADHPLDQTLASLSLTDAMERFRALYRQTKAKTKTKTKNGDAYAAALFLADWLRARPEKAAELLAAIRAGKVPEEMRPAAFLALERCGTPQARTVLIEALRDHGMAPLDRARAASALSDIPQPTRETMATLVASAHEIPTVGDQEGQVVVGTSMRALGHLAERAEKLDPSLYEDLRAELRGDLRSARGVSGVIDAVDAIGNSGDESFAASLKDRMADDSAEVREHAARAFRRMNPGDATAPLVDQLAIESDPSVRAAIADTLSALGVPAPGPVALVAQQLPSEPSPVVRASMIRLLGSAAASTPAAKVALAQQFQRETNAPLLQLIGTYLSADELR